MTGRGLRSEEGCNAGGGFGVNVRCCNERTTPAIVFCRSWTVRVRDTRSWGDEVAEEGCVGDFAGVCGSLTRSRGLPDGLQSGQSQSPCGIALGLIPTQSKWNHSPTQDVPSH